MERTAVVSVEMAGLVRHVSRDGYASFVFSMHIACTWLVFAWAMQLIMQVYVRCSRYWLIANEEAYASRPPLHSRTPNQTRKGAGKQHKRFPAFHWTAQLLSPSPHSSPI